MTMRLRKATGVSLLFGGLKNVINEGDRAFIKLSPLSAKSGDRTGTTHQAAVQAVVELALRLQPHRLRVS